MAEKGKGVFAAKPDNSSSNLGSKWWKKTNVCKLSSDGHMCAMTGHIPPPINT